MGTDRPLVARLLAAARPRQGTVLSYEISDDHVVHRRDFGDASDEADVLSLSVSDDGMIHLRVYFPKLKQTREYGMVRLADGTIRAMYNRDDKNQYSIKDGKFTQTGKPTPPQHKCERAAALPSSLAGLEVFGRLYTRAM